MADKTPEAINAELMATAATYNSQNPTGDSEEDAAAQAAAHALNQATGSVGPDGKPEVRADTPEELAAAAAAKAEAEKEEAAKAAEAEKEAAEKAKAEELAKETPEAKAEREASEAKAAAEAKAAEDAKKKEAGDVEWMTTDNKQFNASLNLMKAAGMKPEEADAIFGEAAQVGDLTKVDRAALVEKVGEDQAELIMAGFTNYVATEGQAILERVTKVHEAVGGTENFAAMSKWARGKAAGDPAFKKQVEDITSMMNSGNDLQADLASKEFLRLYNSDSGNSTITTSNTTVDVTAAKTSPAKPSATPITAREFAEKSDYIMRTKRGADQTAALAALSADRAAGRRKGI